MGVGTETLCDILINDQSDIAGRVDTDSADLLLIACADDSLLHTVLESHDSLLDRIYRDDVTEITDCIESVRADHDPARTSARVQLSADEWCIFEFTIHPAGQFADESPPLFTASNVTHEHFLSQRREVINRVLRHNLRNDMEVISGYTGIARDQCDKDSHPAIDRIEVTTKKLLSLGEKIRDLDSRLYNSNYRLRRVNLREITTRAVEQYHANHPEITFKLAVGAHVIAGNSLVQDAIEELIENAIQHADRPDEEVVITITSQETAANDEISFTVTDNGQGIPRGEAEAISETTESQLNHSSGVGLWLVKWISDSVYATFDIGQRPHTRGTRGEFSFKHAAQLDAEDEHAFTELNKKRIIRTELPEAGSSDIATSTRG